MAPQQHPVTLNSWLQPPQPPEPAASSADPGQLVARAAPASSPPATAPPRLPKRRDDLSLPPPVIPEVPQAMEAAPSLFEMGPGGSAVAALVRVRPFSKKEKRSGAPAAVVVTDEQGERSEHVERSVRVNGCGLKGSNLQFGFDRVAGGKVDQQQFWDSCGIQQMLDAAMEGFGATVFAYGQTGSGKTHTMLGPAGGSAGVDGLIPRAIDYLYTRAQEHSATDPNVTYSLRGSFYEIYNEQVHDLLNPQQLLDADGNATPVNLQVRWNPATESFFVEDLFVVGCDSAEDMTAVLCEGTANRRMGNHAMNKDSSRSHSVFTIEVDVDLGDGAPVRKGKVCLVDLAGSERQKHTHSEGERLKEANSINTSLLVLGKVISALSAAATEAHPPRPPFRDSKLTMVLKDSLGGRSLALMIACVSPSSTYSDESVSTLWYASRAKNIVNRPSVRHGDPKDHQIAALQAEVAGLRHENSLLKQACTSAGVVVPGPDGTDIASKPWQGAADGKDGGAGFLPHIASGGADGKGWRSASANKGGPGNPQQLAALQAEIARLGSEVASLRTEKDAAVEAQRSMMQQLGHAGALSGQLDSLGQMNAQLQGQAQGLVQVNGGLRKSLQVRLTISLPSDCVAIHL